MKGETAPFLTDTWWWWQWWWMIICFYGMVYRRKTLSLISGWYHRQRFSPSRISDTPRAWFETAQNLSSGLVELSCAVVINIQSSIILEIDGRVGRIRKRTFFYYNDLKRASLLWPPFHRIFRSIFMAYLHAFYKTKFWRKGSDWG